VVTTSCLLCHASKLGDSVVIGLGNPNLDFTQDQSFFGLAPLALDTISAFLTPEENVELARYRRVNDAEAEIGRPNTRGMNPADAMFGALAAHRDGETLHWLDEAKPDADLSNVTFTDVPAWWNTKHRQNLFYSGFGRRDHARIMMTASLLCLEDTEEAAAIDSHFGDVEAFIHSLQPPEFTAVAKRPIDMTRANRGRDTYNSTCFRCHGDKQTPPATSVPASVVGTDAAYANYSSQSGGSSISYFFKFFNDSWYGQGEHAGELVRSEQPVYQPPPLDGVWATAPYFHNGSVPTLEAVLKPSLRPTKFRRSFKPEEYDFDSKVGWPFQAVSWKLGDTSVYDTTQPGYRNTGHTFAAGLTDAQRRDLLEYLKTL
jgi:mono/diheme cytochrome c family protein